MGIVKKIIKGTTYLYERFAYRDKKSGKVKQKWKIIGKLDDHGNLIASKGRNLNNLPAEITQVVTIRKKIRVTQPRIIKSKPVMKM